MRVLITITPSVIRAVPALEASGPLSVARGRDRGVQDPFASVVNRLPQFVSAVLTAFDGQGSPILLRVRPTVDHASRSFGIDTDASLQPGKASLLCHSHDEKLWNLRSFVVAGELSRDGDRWVLRPDRFIPGGTRWARSRWSRPFASCAAPRGAISTGAGWRGRKSLGRTSIWSRPNSAAVSSAPARLRPDDLGGPRAGAGDGLPCAGETSQNDER